MISDDTPILAHIVANSAVGRVLGWMESHAPQALNVRAPREREISDQIADRAEKAYGSDAEFQSMVAGPGNTGREGLLACMTTWVFEMVEAEFPALRGEATH